MHHRHTPSTRIAARLEPLESRIAPAGLPTMNLPDLGGYAGFELLSPVTVSAFTSAGDFNGDGFGDILLLAPTAANARGSVFVVFGREGGFNPTLDLSLLTGTDGFRIDGEVAGDAFGNAAAFADVNGDGRSDLLIASPLAAGGGFLRGAVYVIYGKTTSGPVFALNTLNGTNGFKIVGGEDGEGLGASLGGGGDFDDDGFEEMVLGAPLSDRFGIDAGAAYVIYGDSAGFPALVDINAINGLNGFALGTGFAGDHFGAVAGFAGDVNGDGFEDLSVGTSFASALLLNVAPGEQDIGTIVFGNDDVMPVLVDVNALDVDEGFQFFDRADVQLANIAGVADFTGDGIDDFASYAGIASIFTPETALGFAVIAGDESGGFFENPFASGARLLGRFAVFAAGSTVFPGFGDFNGDGFPDLILDRAGDADAELYFGEPLRGVSLLGKTLTSRGIAFTGLVSSGSIGASFVGDIHDDGFDEIVLAVPQAGGAQRIFVLFGTGLGITSGGDTAVFREADGDIITVESSRGVFDYTQFALITPPGAVEDGQSLTLIDLALAGEEFIGANITVKARQAGGGDGFVDLGTINSTGRDIGRITIKGSLGQIMAGDNDPTAPAAKSLTVMGTLGPAIAGTDALPTELRGDVKTLTVKGGLRNASIEITGVAGKITITGELTGDGPLTAAALRQFAETGDLPRGVSGGLPFGAVMASGGISSFTAGSIRGGSVVATGDIGSVKIGGDLRNGSLVSGGAIRTVKIFGEIVSDDPAAPSIITAVANRNPANSAKSAGINLLQVRGDVENARILIGYDKARAGVNPDASVGRLIVNGNWTASSLAAGVLDSTADGFGRNDTLIPEPVADSILARIGSIIIKGTATGSAAAGDHFGITAQLIGSARIGGVKLTLDKTAPDNVLVPGTDDFRIVEVA